MRLFLLWINSSPVICLGFLWPNRNSAVESLSSAHSDAPIPDTDIGAPSPPGPLKPVLQPHVCEGSTADYALTAPEIDSLRINYGVAAAITMTLCEVATAKHYSLPLECRPYLHDEPTGKARISSKVQGECVDSLARSAQFWSSYSGYLREVPQLCHAFRRWNDIGMSLASSSVSGFDVNA
ncbi:hypothetical protein BJ912DRAFT_1055458 [Pholiota molesta]|nr:hypothetical protein BJ912DRAFT_1055458 [Pholiota molesta]